MDMGTEQQLSTPVTGIADFEMAAAEAHTLQAVHRPSCILGHSFIRGPED